MSDAGAARGTRLFGQRHATMEEASGLWWIYLVAGTFWLLLSVIVFRFDYKSVSAISILFGLMVLGAAVNEFLAVVGASTGWKIAHIAFGLACVVIGIVAFIHPGNTFVALAAIMSFYFVLKGVLSVGLAIALRHDNPAWWLQLMVGIAEILIGFWAAGDFGNKTILLVIWVGVLALTRGISAITFAFVAREFREPERLAVA
jgi:uncharacterized membrane protein HdeD (DUF308 family)